MTKSIWQVFFDIFYLENGHHDIDDNNRCQSDAKKCVLPIIRVNFGHYGGKDEGQNDND